MKKRYSSFLLTCVLTLFTVAWLHQPLAAQGCSPDITSPTIDCSQAASSGNLLSNGSFEIGAFHDKYGSTNWVPFGAAFNIFSPFFPTSPAQDGFIYMKLFGGNSGLFEDIPIQGGENLEASVYIMNASFDRMQPGCTGFLKLEFFNAGGGFMSFVESNRIDHTIPFDTWTKLTLNAQAPAGAATARMVVIMQCNAGGAVMFDNASLVIGGGAAGDVTVDNDAGQCGAQVALAQPAHGDNCAVASITNDYNNTDNASDFYPVGTTAVTWTVTDAAGNQSSCMVNVTVNDTEAPEIRCGGPPPNMLINPSFEIGTGFNQYGTANWVPFGGVFGIDGNIIPPAQDGQWYMKLFGNPGGIFQDHPVNPGDNIEGSVYAMNASFDAMQPGCIAFVSLEYFDAGGGFISFTQSPHINHTIPQNVWTKTTVNDVAPAGAATVRMVVIMLCPGGGAVMFDNAYLGNITQDGGAVEYVDNDPGLCTGGTFNAPPPMASDNCPGYTITNDFNGTNDASGFYPMGTTTVTYTITDAAGHTNNCTFDVEVSDTEAPVFANCPADIIVPEDCSRRLTLVRWTPPTVSDNCSAFGDLVLTGPVITNFWGSFPVGTTTVPYTATDEEGNVGSCSFNVTVVDDPNCRLGMGQDAELTVKAFPNPVTHALSVKVSAMARVQLSLRNAVGQELIVQHFDAEGLAERSIDMSDFAAGIYFLKIRTEAETKTVKIIKQ